MRIKQYFSFLFAFFLIGGLIAQVDLVSPKDFASMMKSDENLVILDASKASSYHTNHVKGAVHIDHNKLNREGDVKGLLLPPAELASFFGNLGVGNNSKVVIYDEGSQKYSSRVYWALKYLGKENVFVLHKELENWRPARIMLTAAPASPEPAVLAPKVNQEVFASIDEVTSKKDLDSYVLVDVRTADEFNGVKNSDGHIPGAINLNYEDLLTDTGAFKSKDELKKIAMDHGLTNDKGIIFYCKTSIRATVAFVAFKEVLGYTNVKVFDGAYNEWVASHSVVQ